MWIIYLNNKSISLNYIIFSECDVLLIILNINIYIHQAKQKKIMSDKCHSFYQYHAFCSCGYWTCDFINLLFIKKYIIPIVKFRFKVFINYRK